ncbi:MAG: DUF4147 domain-containing protein [Gammaproteobacteria bacterium]|nr:DUF4147 domain-containing protein [Gammaproteobacteria bacterium]
MQGTPPEPRQLLLHLFQQGLEAVNGRSRVHAALQGRTFPSAVYVAAIGKAAAAMTAGAIEALGDLLVAGLVITRHGYLEGALGPDSRIIAMESGHPLPDEQSLAAGEALRRFIVDAPSDAYFLFLISGGASSLVEIPVPGVSLAELRSLTRWLLASGLPIDEVNRVRAAFSQIKGGRLLQSLAGRPADQLLISDVPGDIPAHIGSGPLLPPAIRPMPELPARFAGLPQTALPQAQTGNLHTQIVATNGMAMDAVSKAAADAGCNVHRHGVLPATDARLCGEKIADFLQHAPAGVHTWGGETTVRLPAHPGRGGRNQALSLSAALGLQGTTGIYLLAAGTDGTDGNTCDAGALVDGGSVARGKDAGLDAAECLLRADAGAFLEASGDLVYTGPTGTNVMDLVIAVKQS